ncbi:aminodeoxychorismate synthase component I [Pokkaliibacter sp. CJK22405]|uniref:aminodeoxychorismate synthase component I n=1 Tax=Pokkaliibacter sp. CJK22405 TaxID=3384615 RepID=UPI003984BF05
MHCEEIPYLSGPQAFEIVSDLPHPILLDSNAPKSYQGRFDIVAAAPSQWLSYDKTQLQLTRHDDSETLNSSTSPFEVMQAMLDSLDPVENTSLPFTGGLMGYWSYDLGRLLESRTASCVDDIHLPWLGVGLYHWAIISDGIEEKCWLVCHPSVSTDEVTALQTRLTTATVKSREMRGAFRLTTTWQANMTRESYGTAFRRIKEYIKAGDCYQVNLAQRFDAGFTGSPWQAYLQLRQHAPTPFAAFIPTEQGAILSLSPERFLQTQENQVETKPIKGTRPRGKTPEEDEQLRIELRQSEKDCAENLMIVDLLRNDLGRTCLPGSISVPKLFDIESYPNVHHMVSTVTGSLGSEADRLPLFEHAFPGGSITGAPKIRAMEIIEELEPHCRSLYCGSIGYISSNGRMDSSITIRTLILQHDRLYCWAGGGIVDDSDEESEYQETLSKIGNLLKAFALPEPH